MSDDQPTFDGVAKCPWCDQTPDRGEPKLRVEVGNAVWFEACLSCACERDNLRQPRRTA